MRERSPCTEEDAAQRGKEYLARWQALTRCTVCSRPMRPSLGTVNEWPATVSGSGGICGSCRERRARGAGPIGTRRQVSTKTRAEIAAGWSPEESRIAVHMSRRTEDPAELAQVLQMLGLLDADREPYQVETRLTGLSAY